MLFKKNLVGSEEERIHYKLFGQICVVLSEGKEILKRMFLSIFRKHLSIHGKI